MLKRELGRTRRCFRVELRGVCERGAGVRGGKGERGVWTHSVLFDNIVVKPNIEGRSRYA